ncbi:unnamed protein product [Trichogramma brassicae]|uniref:Uncharacterized protein n=1 Tax=Trichogramma brassicae TaxID=86971 RepID=A0A6H5I296_9HYME|nr:unnamed protein product [Trichogramma brassicae]
MCSARRRHLYGRGVMSDRCSSVSVRGQHLRPGRPERDNKLRGRRRRRTMTAKQTTTQQLATSSVGSPVPTTTAWTSNIVGHRGIVVRPGGLRARIVSRGEAKAMDAERTDVQAARVSRATTRTHHRVPKTPRRRVTRHCGDPRFAVDSLPCKPTSTRACAVELQQSAPIEMPETSDDWRVGRINLDRMVMWRANRIRGLRVSVALGLSQDKNCCSRRGERPGLYVRRISGPNFAPR